MSIVEGRVLHELKTVSPFFEAVRSGEKTFEVRVNDRDFKVLDILRLRHFNPEDRTYGNECWREVTYVLDDSFPGVSPGYVVLGLTSAEWYRFGSIEGVPA